MEYQLLEVIFMNLSNFYYKIFTFIFIMLLVSNCTYGLSESFFKEKDESDSISYGEPIGEISINSDLLQKSGDIEITGFYCYNPRDYPKLLTFDMNEINVTIDSFTKSADITNNNPRYPFETIINNVEEGIYSQTVTARYDYTIEGEGEFENIETTVTNEIIVDGTPPSAKADASPIKVIPGYDIQFDPSSSGGTGPASVNFAWNFGDGTTSDVQNPTHQYSSTGNYTATLWVNESLNGHNSKDTIDIKVVESVPPSTNIDSPQEGSIIPDEEIKISWTGSDQNGIKYYKVKLDDRDHLVFFNKTSYTFDSVSDGNHTVEVEAFNLDNLSSKDFTNFTVDTKVPKPVITSPDQNQWFNKSNITVHWNCDEPRLDYYEIMKDGGDYIMVNKQTSYSYTDLSEGSHYVKVKGTDIADNKKISDKKKFNVDISKPDINITSPSKYGLVSSNLVNLTWDGYDQFSGIDSYKIKIDDKKWYDIGDEEFYEDVLLDGNHTVKVKAIDKMGYASSDEVNFMVDNSSPTLNIKYPKNNKILKKKNISIRWTGNDTLSSITHYELKIDENDWYDVGLNTSELVQLDEGSHTIKVKAVDEAGNHIIKSSNYTIDVTKPSLNIIYPKNNEYHSNSSIKIKWNGTDIGSGIEHYEVKIDKDNWTYQGLNTTYKTDLSLGNHTIYLKAVDKINRTIINSVNFTVDFIPPSIKITKPSNNTHFSKNNISVDWVCTDLTSGLNYFEIKTNNKIWKNVGKNNSYNLDLSDGVHCIFVRAIDKAMNKNTTHITILIDSTGPNLKITSPNNNATLTKKNTTFRWISNDTISNIDHFEVKIDNTDWVNIGLNHSFNYNFTDGKHTFRVKSYDELGNFRIKSICFSVDVQNPYLKIRNPTDNSYLNKNNLTVRWNGSDHSSGIDHYEIKLDNNTWSNVGSNTSKNISLDEGLHIVQIKAIDKVNHVTTKKVNFTIDTTKPNLNINSPKKKLLVDQEVISFKWSGNDNTSGIKFYRIKFDSKNWIHVGLSEEYKEELNDGNHTICIEAIDKANNSKILSDNFTVDNNPPSIITISPKENDILDENKITISCNTTDVGTSVETHKISIDGKKWINIGKDTSYICNLNNGYHNVRIKVLDQVGHISIKSVNFTVDTNSPSVIITEPMEESYNSDKKIKIKWKSNDPSGSGIEHHEIKINDNNWMNVGLNNSYTSEFSEGEHKIKVKAYDKIGLYSTDIINFTIDRTSPFIQITAPSNDEIIEKNNFKIGWMGEDELSGISSYQIKVKNRWKKVGLNDNYNLTLEDGSYMITVRAVDRTNNSQTHSIQIIVDSEKPTIKINKPVDRSYHNSNDIQLRWTANDTGSGISHYKIKVDYNSWLIVDDNYYNLSLPEGSHDIIIKAYDKSHRYNSENITVNIDTSKPDLKIISPNNKSVYGHNCINCTWECSDIYSKILRYSISVNDNGWKDIDKNDFYEITLKDGENKIRIKAIDIAGNYDIESANFTIDTSPPSMALKINNNSKWTSNRRLSLNITPTNNVGEILYMRTYTENINSSNWHTFESNSKIRLPDIEGKHTVNIQIKDEFGRVSDVYRKDIILDVSEPEGSISILNKSVGSNLLDLDIKCSDPYESIDSLAISNEKNLSNPKIFDYENDLNYTLENRHGKHILYYRFISEHGQKSPIYNISTFLDVKGPELNYSGMSKIIDLDELKGNLTWISTDDSEITSFDVYYSYNNSEKSILGENITINKTSYNFSDNKTITVKIVGFDEFGNKNSINFTIETDVDYPPEFKYIHLPDKWNLNKRVECRTDIYKKKNDSVNISWLVDGIKVCDRYHYIPDLEPGKYNITVIASDGNHTISSSKTIEVEKGGVKSEIPWFLILGICSILSLTGGAGFYLNKKKLKNGMNNEIKSEVELSIEETDIDKETVIKNVYKDLDEASLNEAYNYLRDEKGFSIELEELSKETDRLVEKEIIGVQYNGMDDKTYVWLQT